MLKLSKRNTFFQIYLYPMTVKVWAGYTFFNFEISRSISTYVFTHNKEYYFFKFTYIQRRFGQGTISLTSAKKSRSISSFAYGDIKEHFFSNLLLSPDGYGQGKVQ